MESSTRRLGWLLLFLALFFSASAHAATRSAPYFTLSTYKSFAPSEKPKLHLYTHDVDELEFRIYRVQDPEKFVSGLQEMHSFGDPSHADMGEAEQIDEKTWLERFHDWKADRWYELKTFFRTQFSRPTRDAFKTQQSSMAKRTRIVGAVQFAQIPLLNDKQLVARWRQEVPPTFVSDNQILPIDGLGSGMYLVEATDGKLKAYTVLMVSRTALVTRIVSGQMVAFLVDRKSGVPVGGAHVVMASGTAPHVQKPTAADGTAVFDAPQAEKASSDDPGTNDGSSSRFWVLARSGDDIALVAPWYSSFVGSAGDRYASYAYTDRPVYRPGNIVHFKVIVREHAGDALMLPHIKTAHVTVSDDQQNTVSEQDLPLSAMGSLQGDVTLKADASLGFYRVAVTSGDEDWGLGGVSFRVEDYRKPEYQVKVAVAKARLLQGEANTATIDARYFFGEPVVNAKVKYRVYQQTHYWWGDPSDDDENGAGLNASSDDETDSSGSTDMYGADQNSEQTGRTNADGKLVVPVPTRFAEKQHNDLDYIVEAGVTDEAGREITGRYRFLATYGTYRIHVEPVSYAVQQGEAAQFRVNAVDYDNKPVQTAVHLHLSQHHISPRAITQSDTTLADTDVQTGPDGNAIATVPLSVSGSLSVLASAKSGDRTVQDSTYLWVFASGSKTDDLDDESGQTMQIVADKKSYAPGDTAHLTLIGQVADFHALVTATGYSAEFRKVLTAHGKTLQVDLPITKDSQPNLTVDAVFLQDDKLYQARRSVKVPPTQQQLQVTISPVADVFQPGQAASYDVTARDAQGRPVQAELSFGVVDEAIYALYPDTSGDMVNELYPTRGIYPDFETSTTYYFTGEAGLRSPMLAQRQTRYNAKLAQVKPGNDAKQPHVRKAFPDTALWQAQVRTDASGHARVTLNYPDSLTTWRATVRAVTADSKAGSAINRVLVRKNIIVRMGQPRFVRKGDTLTVPAIVHNYLATAKQVQVSLDATGLDLVNGGTQTVQLAPKADTSVNYRLHASAIGTATLTAKAISDEESDALELSFPVQPAGVKMSVPASGVLRGGAEASQNLLFPAGIDAAGNSLRITVTPSIAGTLFSALDYLTSFPYGCTEQTMSSFLPNILVAEAMKKLGVPLKQDKSRLDAKIDAGIQRLTDYHHDDGGWGWWKEDTSQVFMSAYVVSGLAEARKAGYTQAGTLEQSGVRFLTAQLAAHPRMLPELRAYVAYALAESGHPDAKQLDALYARRSDLSAQALAYTGLAMIDNKDGRGGDIAQQLERKANVQGQLASWAASRNELLDVDGDESAATTAFAIKFLLRQNPDSPLIPKAAQWLVANRNQGGWWGSTQDTAFTVYGLTDYVAATKELDANEDVDVYLNGAAVGHQHFDRADTLRGTTLDIALDAGKLQPQTNTVRVISSGTGKAYWAAQGSYFSTAKQSYQHGTMQLNVARDYFVLTPQQQNDHLVYTLQPLHGPVNQGDVLAVHLHVSGSPQKYLLIEDPIPAGAEFLQRTDGYTIVGRPSAWDEWYTHQEFHDDRAAIFATTFSGQHDSFYLLKVVNPGSYDISPARVSPMYQPGVQTTTDLLHLDVREVVR